MIGVLGKADRLWVWRIQEIAREDAHRRMSSARPDIGIRPGLVCLIGEVHTTRGIRAFPHCQPARSHIDRWAFRRRIVSSAAHAGLDGYPKGPADDQFPGRFRLRFVASLVLKVSLAIQCQRVNPRIRGRIASAVV
jgi:hypothetical protein